MSGGAEREARSVALEKAYVHEVYQQISAEYPNTHTSRTWPRIKQFLEDLEPGSLVCDVGCGNGKYLSINSSIFNLGADRCTKLVEDARDKENEVLVCDNLALPFRDESFDAVLSVAVVHHFATTERRVNALRELARVLRIGGRLVISVWAMEQRHRKFESQDVLVPWHRPQHLSTPSLELTSTTTTTSEEDGPPPYHAYTQTSDSDSCRSVRAAGSGQRKRGRSRHKGRSIDPAKAMTSSPSSSSLSSPNETCYSFVRRALQKLAGGKRGGSRHRPWFLESWTSCASKESSTRRYEPDGCEDIQDLPIELRRLEDDQDQAPQRRQTFTCSHQLSDVPLNYKSKSLSDIINVEQKGIVRSRSSVPSLEVGPSEDIHNTDKTGTTTDVTTQTSLKPRLVKQKKSVCEDDFDGEEGDEPTDMKDLIKALPDFRTSGQGSLRKGNVFKQSSMNEELMSTERLREKERVRQNIQKQASLNEDLMFRRNRTLDSLRDTLFSASTAKRFQLLKSGLSNKIKNSTTGIEKVASTSLKNGFVRILQNWTSSDLAGGPIPQPAPPPPPTPPPDSKKLIVEEIKENERRHSREDGSDSSKDSSLQSDTSVDSEDSFASVIFVPKPEPPPDQTSTNTSPTMQSTPASPQSSSPKFKLPPPISPKLKNAPQISFGMSSHPSSPKLKHPGQLLSSPTPTSPKTRFYSSQPTSPRPYQTSFLTSPTSKTSFKQQPSPNGTQTSPTCKLFPLNNVPKLRTSVCSYTLPNISHLTPSSPTADQPSTQTETSPVVSPTKQQPITRTLSPKDSLAKAKSLTSPKEETSNSSFLDLRPTLSPGLSPTSPCKDTTKRLISLDDPTVPEKTLEKSVERVKQIQELLKQKQSLSSSLSTSSSSHSSQSHQFPIVRRSATVSSSGKSTETRAMTKLMSLELFNPETDDMDSDSSGVSSPDSVGSVISVVNEEEPTTQDTEPQHPDRLHHHESQGFQHEKPIEIEQPSKLTKKPLDNISHDVHAKTTECGIGKLKPTSSLSIVSQTVQSEIVRLEVEQIDCDGAKALSKSPRISPSHSLLEAAADVASTLEETVDVVIQSSPRSKRKQLKLFETPDPLTVLQDDLVVRRTPHRIEDVKANTARSHSDRANWSLSLQGNNTADQTQRQRSHQGEKLEDQTNQSASDCTTKPFHLGAIPKRISRKSSRLRLEDDAQTSKKECTTTTENKEEQRPSNENQSKEETWDEECRQHLADFAEKLSEKLLLEIDRYREHGCNNPLQMTLSPDIIPRVQLQTNIEIMNDPYLNKLSEELQDLTKLSKELQEKHNMFLNQLKGIELSTDLKSNTDSNLDAGSATSTSPSAQVISLATKKDEDLQLTKLNQMTNPVNNVDEKMLGNSSDEFKPDEVMVNQSNSNDLVKPAPSSCNMSLVEIATVKLLKENEKLLRTLENSDKSVNSKTINRNSFDYEGDTDSCLNSTNNNNHNDNTSNSNDCNPELYVETSDIEEIEDNWSDSRRNTILEIDDGKRENVVDVIPSSSEDVTRIEILPGSETLRRPSISVEMSDSSIVDRYSKDKTDANSESRPLHSGISLDSNDAGDISERTASSSDGSRAGSRRDTIQVCDSGSVLSLRPGLSLESSEAGDISERTGSGSESSRAGDSRRNTISIDHTSGSQASLLRPGTSMESSDAGDVSERTASGSDCSRRDTSSAGKTASTASLISDRAGSDCSKDARYADRRIARADGRSSSEETASHRGGLNKLVRQRASTQEPPEMLTKTESCETSLSGSTSQESLMSDSGGGAITFHRYYHVFREGELDQLIERYVENLHIISSYYDHANWCVIAEKVHVWTI